MPWKPIIVGLDGSPESVRATALAWKIAAAARSDCRLVHVVPDLSFGGGLGLAPATDAGFEQRLVDDATVQIRRLLQGVVPRSVLDSLIVRVGRAAVVLGEEARGCGAELVVLGGKHHGALARGFGGSTAHYLARTLDVPLLVTGPSPARLARILVAVDLSYAAAPAIAAARRLAELLGARLRSLHVVEPVRFAMTIPLKVDEETYYQRSLEAFEQLLAEGGGVAPRDHVVRRGPAAETVAAAAADWEADLVVVGSHGRGWVNRMMVGSTTERLLNLQPTSLLVVPVSPLPAKQTRQAGATPARARKPNLKGVVI